MPVRKRKPKFRVGQVVAVLGIDASKPPFESIEGVALYEEAIQYSVESGYFQEDELRPLTRKEAGR